VQTQSHPGISAVEEAGYFEVSDAHLYTVLHKVPDPIARVLLAGPLASERHTSYLPWARWARYLAARHIEVLRYDYRGIGESTGVFKDTTFENWKEDIQLLVHWFNGRSPDLPLILHGLEVGGLLAGHAFESGVGDALLLWSPPANANQALRSTLMRWVGLERIYKFEGEQKSVSDYIRHLEEGVRVEVEGYQWSSRLWRDSFEFRLPDKLSAETPSGVAYNRAVRVVKLPKEAAPLIKGGFIGHDEAKDFSWLFAQNFEWISTVLATPGGGSDEGGG
jgi:hypothetical protein